MIGMQFFSLFCFKMWFKGFRLSQTANRKHLCSREFVHQNMHQVIDFFKILCVMHDQLDNPFASFSTNVNVHDHRNKLKQ